MTPNPTEGKLTEAEIEELRKQLNEYLTFNREEGDTLCDMALESLKAPAATTDATRITELEAEVKRLNDVKDFFQITINDQRKLLTTLSPPAPLSAVTTGGDV